MIVSCFKRFVCLFFLLILAGCGKNWAPVSDLHWYSKKTYVVKRGDTLYSIAFRYDTDYKTLSRINHINPPYSLRVGQVINLRGFPTRTRQGSRSATNYQPKYALPPRPIPAVIHSPANRYARSFSGWLWPVSGHVVTTFIPEQGKKGINIACKKGERVIASASGVVAYAGSGLAGYGNLIIIKHNFGYLTAYGHNARLMVSEGQQVKAGQVIAEAGVIDHKYIGVHFEIRKSGVPVNPLNYLQKG